MKKAGLSSILIAVVLLALGVTAEAQQAKIPPIGYLSSFDPASDSDGTEAIRLALRELGYIEGQVRSATVSNPRVVRFVYGCIA
jgi:hypothetical protein